MDTKQLSKVQFGVEVECMVCDPNGEIYVGEYHKGKMTDCGWYTQRDGSLRVTEDIYDQSRYYKPVEMVSPIITLGNCDQYVESLTKWLSKYKPLMNESCGIHIHIGIPKENQLNFIRNLMAVTAFVEPLLYTTGGVTDRVKSQYCRPLLLRKNTVLGFFERPITLLNHLYQQDHYSGFNTFHMSHGDPGKDTVEFRYYSHSNDLKYTMEYLVQCLEITLCMVRMAATSTKEEMYATLRNFDTNKADHILALGLRKNINNDPVTKTGGKIMDFIFANTEKNWEYVLGADKNLAKLFNVK